MEEEKAKLMERAAIDAEIAPYIEKAGSRMLELKANLLCMVSQYSHCLHFVITFKEL